MCAVNFNFNSVTPNPTASTTPKHFHLLESFVAQAKNGRDGATEELKCQRTD